MNYRMCWKNKASGVEQAGPVMHQEVEDEKYCWEEQLNKKEAEERCEYFNEHYPKANHWIEAV